MTRRRGQHHGDLRRALLDAALELVGEAAPDRLSLRAVARRAGVSPAAPYHHFPDKTALLAAVACEGFEQLMHAQDALACTDPAEHLHTMSATYVRFALAHQTHYAVMFLASPGEVPETADVALRETALRSFGRLVQAVHEANPTLGPDEARRRALLAWSQAHGAVQVARWAHDLDPNFDPDAFAESVGEAILRIAQG